VVGEVYFDPDTGLCKECPHVLDVLARYRAPLAVVGVLLAIILVARLIYRAWKGACKDSAITRPIYDVAKLRVSRLCVSPTYKLMYIFYELTDMTSTFQNVYNIKLPQVYFESTRVLGYGVFNWLSLDSFDTYFFPGQCMQSSFERRLTLRALAPLGVLVAVPPAVKRQASPTVKARPARSHRPRLMELYSFCPVCLNE